MIPAHRAPLETPEARHKTGRVTNLYPLVMTEYDALIKRIDIALHKAQYGCEGAISMAQLRAQVTLRQRHDILTFAVRRPRGQ